MTVTVVAWLGHPLPRSQGDGKKSLVTRFWKFRKMPTCEHRLAQCENPAYTRCYRVCLGCITARTAVCDWASLIQIPFKTTIFADCAFTSVFTRCRREDFAALALCRGDNF